MQRFITKPTYKLTDNEIGHAIGWDLQDLTFLIEELSKRLDRKNETS